MEALLSLNGLISVLTLTLLEVVLGIDNIIFISILAGKVPAHQQKSVRQLGLILALLLRIALLLSITWLVGLTAPLISVPVGSSVWSLSGRDLILLIGGLFLIYSSTKEIHAKFEEHKQEELENAKKMSFTAALLQIIALDVVFSFDSILTAIGIADEVLPMIIAVVISLGVMLLFAGAISNFINTHPTIKMLALSFLLLIGVLLVAEAFHHKIPKGYIYFAVAFSLTVEMLNIALGKKKQKAAQR